MSEKIQKIMTFLEGQTRDENLDKRDREKAWNLLHAMMEQNKATIDQTNPEIVDIKNKVRAKRRKLEDMKDRLRLTIVSGHATSTIH